MTTGAQPKWPPSQQKLGISASPQHHGAQVEASNASVIYMAMQAFGNDQRASKQTHKQAGKHNQQASMKHSKHTQAT
jgi:hypothetical protein